MTETKTMNYGVAVASMKADLKELGQEIRAQKYALKEKQREGEPKPAQKKSTRAWCIDDKTFRPYTPPKGFYTTTAF